VESALAGVGENLAAQVGDWLIASGGEAFWEEDWQGRLDKGKYQEVLNRLKAAALLEVVYQAGRSALVRLPEQWVG
jgi:hypothetical protein